MPLLTISPSNVVSALLAAVLLLLLYLLLCRLLRYLAQRISGRFFRRLLSDDYVQNLLELFPSLSRFSLLNLVELSLRAQTGRPLVRPLGSPRHFIGYDNLMFSPRQLTRLSLPMETPIDMSVTLGKNAQKPLTVSIPLLIAGMAYGLALSKEAKLALAAAAKRLDTAICSGEGPFLPEEAQLSKKFILQICQWSWGRRTAKQISAATMLEVKLGQGADVGTAVISAEELTGPARRAAGLAPKQAAVILPAPPGVNSAADWPAFMQQLRQQAKGIPIALKLMATDRLEEELQLAINLGFDVVILDGSGGGSHATAPIKQDDFGIPAFHALVRAKQLLRPYNISLIIAGGFFNPGQCLKALALGADAIYLGTVPLFALTHNQIDKILPWEPPTTLIFYNSSLSRKLNIQQAADSTANALAAMTKEMQEAMRALGKSALSQLTSDDLVALDPFTAQVSGVKLVSTPGSITPTLTHSLHCLRRLLHQAKQLHALQLQTITLLKHPSAPSAWHHLRHALDSLNSQN